MFVRNQGRSSDDERDPLLISPSHPGETWEGIPVTRLTNFLLTASRSRFLILYTFVLQLGSFFWLQVIGARFAEVTEGFLPFDFQNGLTVEAIRDQLPAYTEASRRLYAYFAAVDFLFPAVASLFLALLTAWSLRSLTTPWADTLLRWNAPAWLVLVALWDWLENIFLLIVIYAYPQELMWAASAALLFKRLKLISLVASAVFVNAVSLTAIFVWLRRKFAERGNALGGVGKATHNATSERWRR